MVYLFWAEGFEEMEVVVTIDILRRCGVEVETVSIRNTRNVLGAHGISVTADTVLRNVQFSDSEAFILPGGMKGTENLLHSEVLRKLLVEAMKRELLVAAICAAPMVLGKNGLLANRKATCYPGLESYLMGAQITNQAVVKEGKLITSRGPAYTADFAFAIAETLVGKDKALAVRKAMLFDEKERTL